MVPDHQQTPAQPHEEVGAAPALRLEHRGHDDPTVQELVAEVQAEYTVRYGGPDSSPVDPAQFEPPAGAFLLALVGSAQDGEPVGMVALRPHAPDADDDAPEAALRSAEIKRLYVRAAHRRRGHARTILALAEERAARMGYRRLVLETGTEQPEAMALYAADGYHPIPGYGHYRCAPLSRSFAKVLPSGA